MPAPRVRSHAEGGGTQHKLVPPFHVCDAGSSGGALEGFYITTYTTASQWTLWKFGQVLMSIPAARSVVWVLTLLGNMTWHPPPFPSRYGNPALIFRACCWPLPCGIDPAKNSYDKNPGMKS